MKRWSRRRLLGTTVPAALGAWWLPGCAGDPAKKKRDPDFDSTCPLEKTVQSLMEETDDAFVPLMKALRDGISADVLYAVAMNASARLATPATDPDMHTNSPMRAAQLLGARLTPAHELLPLFWAWDHLVANRPAGEPMAMLDPALAPANPAQALTDAIAAHDPETADAAIAALYAAGGPDAVIAPIVRESTRGFEWLGHRAIWAAFALRGLDDFGWDCAPWLLRSIARSLAGTQDAPGEALSAATKPRVSELPATWRTAGTDQPSAIPALLAELRTGDSIACVDAVIAAIGAGASPRTIWTALSLAGVEVGVRWREGSFGVHQLDAMNALRNLQTYAPDTVAADELVLMGAAWCPLYRGYVEGDPPEVAEGIDTLAASAGTPTPEDAFAEIGSDITEASRMLLNWLEAGGDASALAASWADLAATRADNPDVHRIKYHAALLEEAEAVLPEWRNRLLLGIPLRSPSSGSPLWSRHDEALALIDSL